MIAAQPLIDLLLPLAVIYARIQACLLAMPGTGERMLPVRIRVGLALALTPMFSAAAPVLPSVAPWQNAVLIGAEIVTGLCIGLLVRLLAMSLDIASTALAQSASLSAMLGISDDMPPHPVGNLMHLAGLALLMAMGLPLLICQVMADSLRIMPPGSLPQIGTLWPAVMDLVVHSFTLALLLASPFILGGLLFQILSGVVARVMPAMPVVFIAAPAVILLALVALAMLVPGLLAIWGNDLIRFNLPEAS